MDKKVKDLIDTLEQEHTLNTGEYACLISSRDPEAAAYLAQKAVSIRRRVYGNEVYIRGLIEISNICKNNCLYCGIRRGNSACSRYRLRADQILDCCRQGYDLGFRTFVLQGGEDPFFDDDCLTGIVRRIRESYPDCAVTLSMGERSRESYQRLYEAGADRYLLRHETADEAHYRKLHPAKMSFSHRMQCLRDLQEIGYQVGCGFMVGSPFQTPDCLAQDLKFIEEFKPAMCGIGPFIPHRDTPFGQEKAGSLELTLFLLSMIRLIAPGILLPATTALGTIDPRGRELGILSGANVVMPNLSPTGVRGKYELYNNKICTGEEAAEGKNRLDQQMQSIGYRVVVDRGDSKVGRDK
jgi:biotin synthase